ncbi:MAG: DUF2304 domain-containing protein [Lachnospiraceae bacterium]|nr:DUF2304 domain-containing protein [Lachnospiraceae bacterium]
MTSKFQIILIVGILLILLLILNMIRKRKLELKYSLVWLIVMIMLLFIAGSPEKLAEISKALGIYSPVNMVFFLGFVFSLIIIFVLTVTVSRLSARIRRLAQIVAMLNSYNGEPIEDDLKEKIEKEVQEIVGDKK